MSHLNTALLSLLSNVNLLRQALSTLPWTAHQHSDNVDVALAVLAPYPTPMGGGCGSAKAEERQSNNQKTTGHCQIDKQIHSVCC